MSSYQSTLLSGFIQSSQTPAIFSRNQKLDLIKNEMTTYVMLIRILGEFFQKQKPTKYWIRNDLK
jgi:hypothetical protein